MNLSKAENIEICNEIVAQLRSADLCGLVPRECGFDNTLELANGANGPPVFRVFMGYAEKSGVFVMMEHATTGGSCLLAKSCAMGQEAAIARDIGAIVRKLEKWAPGSIAAPPADRQ